MTEKIKFIHCADLHLDSPFKGMSTLPDSLYQELKNSTFAALDNLVNLAIKEQVDFVLIVGDLFDQSVKSVYAEMQFIIACQKLNKVNIPIYLSYGNHDYLEARQHTFTYPENVHIFESDQVEVKVFSKNGHPLVGIHGFSYSERAVLDNKTTEFQPVEGLAYQIGMLHGSIQQSTEHDYYAPFQLSDLQTKNIDYWALGHIHKRAILSRNPAIVYPGNTQSRSIKESGEKGCYLVELNQMETKLTFKALHAIQFDRLSVNVSDCQQVDQLYDLLYQRLSSLKKQKSIIFLTLTGVNQTLVSHYYQGEIDEIIMLLNEQQQDQENWQWIQAVEIERERQVNEARLKENDPFMNQLLTDFEDINWGQLSKDLWQHRQAKRFLVELSEEEKIKLVNDAKDLALYHLLGMNNDENK
ncbi:DNA repair exonuclease [Amphibacillus sp. MSJ-3]|uniref:metallophosphoesterase family protein n=1 Tax=Amphibacillus sp. MSJ-3 TaxID=2841505 RepID=UPI001C0EA75B|nr:DNA repair exonuclease [Amphibacillus sp. MSJ-3]MBU5593995.1 DNA repair exonuclease [Amphibacillus sp. MSJ-3]